MVRTRPLWRRLQDYCRRWYNWKLGLTLHHFLLHFFILHIPSLLLPLPRRKNLQPTYQETTTFTVGHQVSTRPSITHKGETYGNSASPPPNVGLTTLNPFPTGLLHLRLLGGEDQTSSPRSSSSALGRRICLITS